MCITEVLFMPQVLLIYYMITTVANCFAALKSSRKKSPYFVNYKSGDLPIL